MDPADSDMGTRNFQQALSHEGNLLGQHGHLLNTLTKQHQTLLNAVTQLHSQFTRLAPLLDSVTQPPEPAAAAASPPAPLPAKESHATDPETFSGDLGKCRGFLMQCAMMFSQKPLTFSSESSKICFVLGLLRGQALAWAEAMHSNNQLERMSFDVFMGKLRSV